MAETCPVRPKRVVCTFCWELCRRWSLDIDLLIPAKHQKVGCYTYFPRVFLLIMIIIHANFVLERARNILHWIGRHQEIYKLLAFATPNCPEIDQIAAASKTPLVPESLITKRRGESDKQEAVAHNQEPPDIRRMFPPFVACQNWELYFCRVSDSDKIAINKNTWERSISTNDRKSWSSPPEACGQGANITCSSITCEHLKLVKNSFVNIWKFQSLKHVHN